MLDAHIQSGNHIVIKVLLLIYQVKITQKSQMNEVCFYSHNLCLWHKNKNEFMVLDHVTMASAIHLTNQFNLPSCFNRRQPG